MRRLFTVILALVIGAGLGNQYAPKGGPTPTAEAQAFITALCALDVDGMIKNGGKAFPEEKRTYITKVAESLRTQGEVCVGVSYEGTLNETEDGPGIVSYAVTYKSADGTTHVVTLWLTYAQGVLVAIQ